MDNMSWKFVFILGGLIWFAAGVYLIVRGKRQAAYLRQHKTKKRGKHAPKTE